MGHREQISQNFTPADLVAGILSGDRRIEGELVSRYWRGVAMILGRMLDVRDVEDATQEVLLRAIEKVRRGEVREPEKLSGYICSLARNFAIGELRKVRRGVGLPEDDFADAAEDALGALLRKEDEVAVQRVLDELGSERDREILTRFYLEEDSKESICRDLGIGSLHFNRVLYRARERFRELYRTQTRKNSPG